MNAAASPRRALRVVQWTTGNVARQAVRAVLVHPGLDLVGAFAHSADKVGRDVGTLCGFDPVGVTATDDVDGLLALDPDCVVYTPLHFSVEEVARLLGAGVNVVTTSEFLSGTGLGDDERRRLEQAAQLGGATLFGTGMNPGFAQLLGGVVAGVCTLVHHVRITESFDVSLFAVDGNMDELGWGRPSDDPGHPEALRAATVVFADALDVLAALFDVTLEERRCTVRFSHATVDLDLPGRPVAAGTVAGIDLRWEGVVEGRPVFELRQVWAMGSALDPPLPVDSAYTVEVDGEPRIATRFEIWPHQDDLAALTPEDFHALGMRITALPAVNAIPAVCAAPPGIRTYADLPVISPRGRLRPRG
ncbi:MAG: hypothetical protein MUF83_13970 [Acidimicrobiales bacterium]|nr:hypothetical protein [Acidimicrobiales bacterium]